MDSSGFEPEAPAYLEASALLVLARAVLYRTELRARIVIPLFLKKE